MKKKRRYYSRLQQINAAIFTIAILMLGVAAYFAFLRVNVLEKRQSNSKMLIKLEQQITSKHDDFYKMFLPFYNSRNQQVWNKFLSDDSDAFLDDYEYNKSLNDVFKDVCMQDKDVKAVFVTKGEGKKCYLFMPQNNYLERVSNDTAFCRELLEMKGNRQMFSRNPIVSIGKTEENGENLYMIAGTVLGSKAQAGDLIRVGICYSTNALGDVLASADNINEHTFFGITTMDGNIIYASDENYIKSGNISDTIMDALQSKETIVREGRTKYLMESQVDVQRNYIAFYMVPESFLNQIPFGQRILLIGTATISIAMIILLSVVSSYFMKRRMQGLIIGMGEIGKNNLDYRIPIDTKKNDEFTEISAQFNRMSERLLTQIEQTYVYEMKRRTAEFKALQTSINPHFLYNTLEAIREWLDQSGEEDGAEMIVMLSRLMEYQIRGGSFVTIGEELEKLKAYINLFSLRHYGEFQYEINVSDSILRYMIPKHTLQPVLENYFIHGYRVGGFNKFWIDGVQEGEDIILTIRDNGLGMRKDELLRLRNEMADLGQNNDKLGLCNVHNRLRIAFGESYGIDLNSMDDKGTTVLIKMAAMLEIKEISRGKDLTQG